MPPRIEAFQSKLAAGIPCFSNESECRVELAAKSLPELINVYLNWANRFIRPSKRTVSYAPGFWDSPYAARCRPAVLALAAEMESGTDLARYLSEKVMTHGYASRTLVRNGKAKGPEWLDKDFGLNAYDTHHLHLGRVNQAGKVTRESELVYVNFSRDAATMVLLGDHKSFDDGSLAQAVARWHTGSINVQMPYTPKGLQRLHRAGITTLTVSDGKVFIGTELSSDGSSTIRFAQHIAGKLLEIDSTIDAKKWQQKLFAKAKLACPENPQFQWQMVYCDLMLVELSTGEGFRVAEWRR